MENNKDKQEEESQVDHNTPVDKSVLKGIKIGKHPIQVKEAGEELYVASERTIPWNKEADKQAEEWLEDRSKTVTEDMTYEEILEKYLLTDEEVVKLREVANKVPEAATYNTLEEILTEIKAVGSMLYIKMPEVEEVGYIINVMEKLKHTISTGKYIQDGTR